MLCTLPGEELKVSEESSEENPCVMKEEDLLILLFSESFLIGGWKKNGIA